MEKQYSVYMHINKINNKKYIGLTSLYPQTKRWQHGQGYKDQFHFYSAIQKYGWDNFEHIIIKENLTKKEASLLEQELIIKYNTLNSNYGYNKREGGIEDYTLTQEAREKMGWAKGTHFSKEHKENIGKALKNRIFTTEAKLKMSEAKKRAGTFQGKNNPKAQKVKCIENNQVFNTIKEAADFAQVTRDGISKACRGIQKTSGGYHWTYIE